MIHSFETRIAERFGIASAVILNNIYYWVEKNRANGINKYDGNYWTYNSRKAFAELFPYLSPRQIDHATKKLIEAGVIITGNYNAKPYDRTLWYAITKLGYSILQNCEMENAKMSNGFNTDVKPIPDIKPNNKTTDIKTQERKTANASFDKIISDYANGNNEILELLGEWLKVRKAKRAAMTNKAIELNLKKLDRMAAESALTVPEYLREVICRGWNAFYPIKNYSGSKNENGGNIFLNIAKDEGIV